MVRRKWFRISGGFLTGKLGTFPMGGCENGLRVERDRHSPACPQFEEIL